MGDLREDSTKGNAKMMPVNYKGDVLAQVWLDARKLAVLSEWLDKGGYNTRHLSEVIKFTVDEVVEQIVEAGLVSKIEFTGDAREMLTMKYRTELNPSKRGMRNVVHNLRLDDLRKGNIYKDEKEQRIYGTGFGDVESATRKGVEMYNKLESAGKFKDQQEAFEESKKRAESMYESAGVTSSGETILRRKDNIEPAKSKPAVTREGMSDVELRQQEQDSLDKLKDM